MGMSGKSADGSGDAGLDTTGLLVRARGRVVEIEPVVPPTTPSWFKIDDGGGMAITCAAAPGSPIIDRQVRRRHRARSYDLYQLYQKVTFILSGSKFAILLCL